MVMKPARTGRAVGGREIKVIAENIHHCGRDSNAYFGQVNNFPSLVKHERQLSPPEMNLSTLQKNREHFCRLRIS